AVPVGPDPEQAARLDPEAGLLLKLTPQRLERLLSLVDEAAGQVPESLRGLMCAAGQQDAPLGIDADRARSGDRVRIRGEPADRAVGATGARADRRAAARAEAPFVERTHRWLRGYGGEPTARARVHADRPLRRVARRDADEAGRADAARAGGARPGDRERGRGRRALLRRALRDALGRAELPRRAACAPPRRLLRRGRAGHGDPPNGLGSGSDASGRRELRQGDLRRVRPPPVRGLARTKPAAGGLYVRAIRYIDSVRI